MLDKKIFISASLLCASALQGFSWGQKGHDTVSYIAENHLTSVTKAAVERILNGRSMVYYSNWMDNASHTPEYAYSSTWHYKNIDADETYDNAPYHQDGDVTRAIRFQVATLQDDQSTPEQQATALKMLIHLVGDVHQPMHLGHRSDRGGNSWTLRYKNMNTNLHSLWDSKLVEGVHNWSYTEWQQQIDRATPAQSKEILTPGTPEKWGEESYKIATEIYNTTPKDSNQSFDYDAKWAPVIEDQLLKGGLRLADILNAIYDPSYTASNLFVKR